MSKILDFTFHTVSEYKCTLKSVAELLKKASLSVTDSDNKFHIMNDDYDFEVLSIKYKEFLKLPQNTRFKVFGDKIRETEVTITEENSFSLCISAYIVKTEYEGILIPDFNFYYSHLYHKVNANSTIIERMDFMEF